MAKQKITRTYRRARKNIEKGQTHITSALNNIMAILTDISGNVISWASVEQLGFHESRRSTPFATQRAAQEAAEKAKEHGSKSVEVFVEGPGFGHETAIHSFQALGLEVTMIKDVTPIPYNGCRPPKRRRV